MHRKAYMRDEDIMVYIEDGSQDGQGSGPDFDDEDFDNWLKSCRIGIDDREHLSNIGFLEGKFSEGPNPRNSDVEFKEARKVGHSHIRDVLS